MILSLHLENFRLSLCVSAVFAWVLSPDGRVEVQIVVEPSGKSYFYKEPYTGENKVIFHAF